MPSFAGLFTGLISGLSFGAPLLLYTLIGLPIIYYLLRVTPPAPKRIVFPPLRLLFGLKSAEETPARTPWWLLLLRLIAAALAIIAVADTPGRDGPRADRSDPRQPAGGDRRHRGECTGHHAIPRSRQGASNHHR